MIKFTSLMRWIKKYVSILFLLVIFPLSWFVGRTFVTNQGSEIYAYIPQDCDIVIEVNNVNFIGEFAYQRVYHESYVLDKIDFEEVDIESGIDPFSKIILFREQWAQEYVWFAVIAYTSRDQLKKYIQTKLNGSHMAFGDGHCIVQLSESKNQAKMDERLKQIAGKEIKPFTARVNLYEYFSPEKEMNCYFIPPTGEYKNHIIDGHLSFEFLQDHVEITGELNPVSDLEALPTVNYALNNKAAFSLRSSLNIFNSIYWFSKEKIDNVPDYRQMALDYEGVNMMMVDGSFGYEFPFKKFPDMNLRFDLAHQERWQAFYDTLLAHETIRVDTTANMMATKEGTFFKYRFNDEVFELGKNVSFEEMASSDICFDLQFKIGQLLDNTKFAIDENNPPSSTLQMIFMSVAEDMVEDLRVLENVEQITFQLKKESETKLRASGSMTMENPDGHSVVESILFAQESIYFISQALEVAADM